MQAEKKRENNHTIIIGFCLLFFATLLLQGSTLPFVGVNAWNFNTYSLIARNYTIFGYFDTLFAPIISVVNFLPGDPEYYLHHPQLLSIIQALFFGFLGENFFVARLPVIIASLISAFLIYVIARELKDRTYGLICLAIAVLIPGFSIFGRMIGQEALVLMFSLMMIYFYVRFSKTGSRAYALFSIITVILGSLSDWPMAYFVMFFAIFAYHQKSKKLYIVLLLTTTITMLGFLAYVLFLNSGFGDLRNAFLVRGPGQLISSPNWYFTWPFTIGLRLLIYTNPIFVFAAVAGFYVSYKTRMLDKVRVFYLLLSLLLFGFSHVVLYPEGSFGHAYWIIYILPFFILASGLFFYRIKSHRAILLSLFLVSFMYVLMIVYWKTAETKGNLFRYTAASVISAHIPKYQTISVNPGSAIDPDLLEYSFSIDSTRAADKENLEHFVVYTCSNSCRTDDLELLSYLDPNESIKISSPEIEGRLFGLKNSSFTTDMINVYYNKSSNKNGIFRKTYAALSDILGFPQL